jgi:hypothetical protein
VTSREQAVLSALPRLSGRRPDQGLPDHHTAAATCPGIEALQTAPGFGLHVPRVLAHGQHQSVAWTVSRSTSDFLADQHSDRVQTLPTWPSIRNQLRVVDALPIVHLHGYVKPDHILVDGANGPFLVNREASGLRQRDLAEHRLTPARVDRVWRSAGQAACRMARQSSRHHDTGAGVVA